VRVALVVAGLLAGATPGHAPVAAEPAAAAPVAEISRAELAKHPAALILDVRTAEEYHAGHVPGAVNIPHEEVAAALPHLEPFRDREVVVYCRSGRRAALALEVLRKAGFADLEHMEGDMQGWDAAGLPVETTDVPLPKP
jgi:rhodanese-related sulfurtransferase